MAGGLLVGLVVGLVTIGMVTVGLVTVAKVQKILFFSTSTQKNMQNKDWHRHRDI